MIYESIKKICDERGLSIYKLERELNLSNGAVAKWRTSTPSSKTLYQVARYLDVSMDELLEDENHGNDD